MAKGNKKSLFWTSYSDLMTSLFFTLLVLFVVAIIAMGQALKKANDLQIATQAEIDKIHNIENSDTKTKPFGNSNQNFQYIHHGRLDLQ